MKMRHRKLHAASWFLLTPLLLLITWLALGSGDPVLQPVNPTLTPDLIQDNAPKGAIP